MCERETRQGIAKIFIRKEKENGADWLDAREKIEIRACQPMSDRDCVENIWLSTVNIIEFKPNRTRLCFCVCVIVLFIMNTKF